ncbi:unannotated protein [freshwater metagenome]|uniref:Unannotated protein n=1 Tax=freshwater metagenome TaxID=449393 RepID=A0A6J6PCU8_9ZZZZ
MVCCTSGHPSRSNNAGARAEPESTPPDDVYKYGMTLFGPDSAMVLVILAAIKLFTSAQVAAVNWPEPRGPLRMSGVSTRSGAYTRLAWCFTFWQMNPWVNGFADSLVSASIATMRPSSTVTASEHVSGQSSGQAVVST